MKKLFKALAIIFVVLIVIAAGLGVAGHFVIVGLFGENGSVAKLGFSGYGDLLRTVNAVTASPAKVDPAYAASDENDQKLYDELSAHTYYSALTKAALNSGEKIDVAGVDLTSLDDKEKMYVAFYGGISSQSSPVTISGGMHAAGLAFLKEKGLLSTSSDFDFDVKGISVSDENNGARFITLVLSVKKDDILAAIPSDAGFVKDLISSFLHSELTASIKCQCAFVNGAASVGEATVSLNSASASDCRKIVDYVNETQDGAIDSLPSLIEEFINAPLYTREPITGVAIRTASANFDGDGNIVYSK